MECSTPGFPVPHHLLEFAQVHIHWIGDTIQPSHPLLPSSPSAFNLSQHQGLFQWAGSSHQVAKYWSFSISSSSEYSGLISFRIDGFDLLAVQGTLQSLLQHHNSKASIRCSAFFMVQPSHLYMTTGRTIALSIHFVSKVMSLLFNTLSRFLTVVLPGSKHLLISWLRSLSAVVLEPPKINSHCFYCSPMYLPWSDGTGCHDLCFLNVEL